MVLEKLYFKLRYKFYSVNCINNHRCTVWFLTNAYLWVIYMPIKMMFLLTLSLSVLTFSTLLILITLDKSCFFQNIICVQSYSGYYLSLASQHEYMSIQPGWCMNWYSVPFCLERLFHDMNLLWLFLKPSVGFLLQVGEETWHSCCILFENSGLFKKKKAKFRIPSCVASMQWQSCDSQMHL